MGSDKWLPPVPQSRIKNDYVKLKTDNILRVVSTVTKWKFIHEWMKERHHK